MISQTGIITSSWTVRCDASQCKTYTDQGAVSSEFQQVLLADFRRQHGHIRYHVTVRGKRFQ